MQLRLPQWGAVVYRYCYWLPAPRAPPLEPAERVGPLRQALTLIPAAAAVVGRGGLVALAEWVVMSSPQAALAPGEARLSPVIAMPGLGRLASTLTANWSARA
jgi:hypothetical protein